MIVRVGRIDECGRGRLRLGVAEVDDRNVQLLAQRAGHVVFGDDAALDEQGADALPVRLMRDELDRFTGDHSRMYEEVSEANAW